MSWAEQVGAEEEMERKQQNLREWQICTRRVGREKGGLKGWWRRGVGSIIANKVGLGWRL